MPGGQNPAIGDEECAMEIKAACQLAHPLNHASTEHDSRARLKVEWDHLQ
jgi:hypothetical protein